MAAAISPPNSRAKSSPKSKLEYTFAKTFKRDALQVQTYKDHLDHPDAVFNIKRVKKAVSCPTIPVEELTDSIYDAKHYERGRTLVQYNTHGVLFYPTSKSLSLVKKGSKDLLLWCLDKKTTGRNDMEFKLVDYTTRNTIGKWRKSHSELGGWTLKKTDKHTGEKMVLARYYEGKHHLDIFPHNFVNGMDESLDAYSAHLKDHRSYSESSQISGSTYLSKVSSSSSISSGGLGSIEGEAKKPEEPFSASERIKFSEAIMFSLLVVLLHIDSEDDQLVATSSLSTPCVLTNPELLLRRHPTYKLASFVAKRGPIVMKKVLGGSLKR